MTTEKSKNSSLSSRCLLLGFITKCKWKFLSIIFILVIIVCGSVAISFFIHRQRITDPDSYRPLKMISRNEWTAQSPDLDPVPLHLPVDRLIIAHTNTTSCNTKAHCTLIVRTIQADHVEIQKLDDIAYNFLIGGTGIIYYGRGWHVEGQHTHGFNSNSLCIAMVGTFDTIEPLLQQLDAAQQLIAEGIRLQKVAKNYRLYGQRQLNGNTTSPGQKLFEILKKTWSHWTSQVE